MRPTLVAIALAAFAVLAPGAALAQTRALAIVDAEIFDGTGAPPFTGMVVVQDGLIQSVSRTIRPPRGAKIMNARGLALLPGLHDVHTHYFSIDRGRYNPSEVNYAYLSVGVTAVGDFSQGPEAIGPRQTWFDAMPAPSVFPAGRIAPYRANIWDWGDPATSYWADTPDGARLAVKDIDAAGFKIIKGFTDGWRYGNGPDTAGMDEPTLTALVKEAKAAGLPVLTHTMTLVKGKEALRAGVSAIAHALQDKPVDAELLGLIRPGETFYAPSLQTYEPVKPGQTPPPADAGLAARQARFQLALDNVKAMHDAGALLVTGSDSGSSRNPHGRGAQREIELLVKAGLTPAEALIAATANSARLFQRADAGTIAPGKRADLVLVAGKPWIDISDIRKVDTTFVAGKVVYEAGTPPPLLPETPPALTPASPLIADFERKDLRTPSGALIATDLDRNGERSWQVLNITPRDGGGHALMASAAMARRPDPRTEVVIPLAPGGVQPVDARAFTGLATDLRGDGGAYTLAVMTPAGAWTAPVKATEAWSAASVDFLSLTPPAAGLAWTGDDILAIRFRLERPAGAATWLEIDNLSFR
jgi:imidazolonepropionase-like amidohydrolase